MKILADKQNTVDVAQVLICVFDRVENIVGKGKNAGIEQYTYIIINFLSSLMDYKVLE